MPCCCGGGRKAAKRMQNNVVPPIPVPETAKWENENDKALNGEVEIEVIESPKVSISRHKEKLRANSKELQERLSSREYDMKRESSSVESGPKQPIGITLQSDQPIATETPVVSFISSKESNVNRFSLKRFQRQGGGSKRDEDPINTGRAIFSNYLKKCYSHEVLDYWDLTGHYISLFRKSAAGAEQAKELGRRMVAEYVAPGAPQKLDLGHAVEDPLLEASQTNKFTPNSFDATRRSLLKLLLGLRMDANVSLGVKSKSANAVASFLDEEERKMHVLTFQRDVHPLLFRFRKNTTVRGNGQNSPRDSTGGSGIFQKTSQVLSDVFGSPRRRGSSTNPRSSRNSARFDQ